MGHPTTIQFHRTPGFAVRQPGSPADLSRIAAVAIHVATAAVLAASIAASLASAGDRVTGMPSRLTEPSTIVRPVADPALVEPIPEPMPAGA